MKSQSRDPKHRDTLINNCEAFGSPRSILRIKPRMSLVTTRPIPYLLPSPEVCRMPRMYADGLLPEATTTTPIAT